MTVLLGLGRWATSWNDEFLYVGIQALSIPLAFRFRYLNMCAQAVSDLATGENQAPIEYTSIWSIFTKPLVVSSLSLIFTF